jgi:hypothetical protein
MQRRDLLKGALALPAFAGLNSWAQARTLCTGHGICQPSAPGESFQLILRGPFGLALHNPPDITGITAFVPVDPDGRHHWAIEGRPQNNSKKFSFALKQSMRSNKPFCVETEFQHFCAEKTTFKSDAKDKLLTLQLAPPVRITTFSSLDFLTVNFKKSGSTGKKWYRSFVIEYEVTDSNPIELSETTSGVILPTPKSSFTIEVGLKDPDHDDNSLSHAKKFYNDSLLAFFPDLITDDHIVSTASTVATATTFECKAGGIIGGTSP